MLAKVKSDVSSQEMVLRQSNKISRSPMIPSLEQAKLYRYFLMKARKDLLERDYHQVYQEELKDFLNTNDWSKLKESVELLSKVDIRWDLLPQKEEGDEIIWGTSPLLADCEIKEDARGKIYFRYSFSPKMRKELASPQFFREFDFQLIRDFRINYALKFYEFCLASIEPEQQNAVTELISKETFWELLGLKQEEYESYKDFKEHIANQAVLEVNEITDLRIRLMRKKMDSGQYGFYFKIKRQRIQTRLKFSD